MHRAERITRARPRALQIHHKENDMVTTPVISMKRRQLEDTIRSARGDPMKIDEATKAVDRALSKAYAAANVEAQKAAANAKTVVERYAPDTKIPEDYARPAEAAEAIYIAVVKLEGLDVPIYGLTVPPVEQLAAIVPMMEAVGWEEGTRLALGK